MKLRQCIHCRKSFKPNPRVKNQKYCGDKACRRARRARWQRDKMTRDAAYKDNQGRCQKQWQAAHPGYYKDYRAGHPEYVVRNRLLQIGRDARRRKNGPDMLAKMDSLTGGFYPRREQLYRLVPQEAGLLAKMDPLTVKIIPVNRLRTHKRVSDCLQKRTR